MKAPNLPIVKILIVDDRQENLIALQAAFKGSGYVLFEALSGKQALELAKHHDFACILLDVQMPILDGFKTAEALRKIPRSEVTPIIFVTAIHRSEQYEELGYVAGAVDYLFKPINPKILTAKVSIFVELFLQSEEIKRKNYLLEQAIQKSKEYEQLKETLRARDEFLMMASHELKTPITPLYLQMQTFIQLFESGLAYKTNPEKLLRMLHTSQGQVERLTRLISELVDVSKISAQKLDLHKSKICLSELTKKVLEDFEAEIKATHSEFIIEYLSQVFGFWDSFRIEQVIVNLLTNALKYGGGKPIHLKVFMDENHGFFEIKDHGIGISSENHERIFHRFERAVSAESYSGLGLGLFISQQIIELHGGKIWVESEAGLGSTFKFKLPLIT